MDNCNRDVTTDGDKDDITNVIRVHWVMKKKRLMVFIRKEVDENSITDGRMKLRESRFLGVNRIKTFLFCCLSTI